MELSEIAPQKEKVTLPSTPWILAAPCAALYIARKIALDFLDAPAFLSAASRYLWLTESKAASKSIYVTTRLVSPCIILS